MNTCPFCNDTLQRLKAANYNYVEVDVDDPRNDQECAKLEKFFNSARYPKVVVRERGVNYFINPNDGDRPSSRSAEKFLYYNSPNDIINYIKQIKNHEI